MKFNVGDKVIVHNPSTRYGESNLAYKNYIGTIKQVSHPLYYLNNFLCFFDHEIRLYELKKLEDWL